MANPSQGLKRAIRALRNVTRDRWEAYYHVAKHIAAQWVLESGWGNDDLPLNLNNFGGMKYRKCLDHLGFKATLWADWSGAKSLYFELPSPEHYPELYFNFIQRSVYNGHIEHLQDGEDYIKFIVSCGYCTEQPGSTPYHERINSILRNKDFQEMWDNAEKSISDHPSWINTDNNWED